MRKWYFDQAEIAAVHNGDESLNLLFSKKKGICSGCLLLIRILNQRDPKPLGQTNLSQYLF